MKYIDVAKIIGKRKKRLIVLKMLVIGFIVKILAKWLWFASG